MRMATLVTDRRGVNVCEWSGSGWRWQMGATGDLGAERLRAQLEGRVAVVYEEWDCWTQRRAPFCVVGH